MVLDSGFPMPLAQQKQQYAAVMKPTYTQLHSQLRDIHVLVIDDDRRVAKLLRSVLEGLGFGNIHVKHSAEEADGFLRKQSVDLVICDWMMDGRSGISLVEEFRRDVTHPNQLVPVLMLSGNAEKPQVEAARDSGVTEYVMKPFTAKSLCSRIITIIENPRSFVMSPNFYGHNRRRKTLPIDAERRKPRK